MEWNGMEVEGVGFTSRRGEGGSIGRERERERTCLELCNGDLKVPLARAQVDANGPQHVARSRWGASINNLVVAVPIISFAGGRGVVSVVAFVVVILFVVVGG